MYSLFLTAWVAVKRKRLASDAAFTFSVPTSAMLKVAKCVLSLRSQNCGEDVESTSQAADFPLSLLERLRTPPQVRAGEVFGRGANVFGK